MARPNLQLRLAHSRGLRYGFAATSCAMALGVALLAHRYDFLNMEAPLFLLAICRHRLVDGDWACDSCSCTFKFSLRLLFCRTPLHALVPKVIQICRLQQELRQK